MPSEEAQHALAKAKAISPDCDEFRVRLYDGFDNEWMDVPYGKAGPFSAEQAMKVWDKYTEKGTRATSYSDIDYYAIYPADTTMMLSKESVFRNG